VLWIRNNFFGIRESVRHALKRVSLTNFALFVLKEVSSTLKDNPNKPIIYFFKSFFQLEKILILDPDLYLDPIMQKW
jgi:hypothetical protein